MSEPTTQPTKQRYDMNSPQAKALIDEIVHGTFMKEGTMVAFPTCFPGATIPIPADESHITALDIGEHGMVYGGTSGRATHLLVGMFHGVTGIIFDLGVVLGATHCAAICCGKDKFVACVNGADGGRVVISDLAPLPFDLMQEWGFGRPPIQNLGTVDGSPILHALADDAKQLVFGITEKHLFTVDFAAAKIESIAELQGNGRIAVGSKANIFGRDGARHLWRYNTNFGKLDRHAIELPVAGDWGNVSLTWARDRANGLLYTADADGTLFSFDEDLGFSAALGKTLLAPVGTMAVTHDGRLFGFCGSEMAKMFCYDPKAETLTNLGVAVSVLERRRYGYVFADAVTGRDGQIYFGEDDSLGHLWMYFPRIAR